MYHQDVIATSDDFNDFSLPHPDYTWGEEKYVSVSTDIEVIELPYSPRHPTLHEKLANFKTFVLVAHRRFGKTVLMVAHMVQKALELDLEDGAFYYAAPLLKQAKKIAWRYLLKHYNVIKRHCPKATKNETELYIKIPNSYIDPVTGEHGWSYIYVIGVDNPDSIRGIYADGVILDEYGQMNRTAFEEIFAAMLSDKSREKVGNQWAIFLGTPKGQNQFWEIYESNKNKMVENSKTERFSPLNSLDDWGESCGVELVTISHTRNYPDLIRPISESRERFLRSIMSRAVFAQEFECDFNVSSDDSLIPLDLIREGFTRYRMGIYQPRNLDGHIRILGFDGSRSRGDNDILTYRWGNLVMWQENIKHLNEVEKAEHINDVATKLGIDAICVDSFSFGLISMLQHTYRIKNVHSIDFGGGSSNPKYLNKRVEMYHSCKKWLETGGALPENDYITAELSAPVVGENNNDKLVLQPKKAIVEEIGRSPDYADSLVLTFSLSVPGKSNAQREEELMMRKFKSNTRSSNQTNSKFDVLNRPKRKRGN